MCIICILVHWQLGPRPTHDLPCLESHGYDQWRTHTIFKGGGGGNIAWWMMCQREGGWTPTPAYVPGGYDWNRWSPGFFHTMSVLFISSRGDLTTTIPNSNRDEASDIYWFNITKYAGEKSENARYIFFSWKIYKLIIFCYWLKHSYKHQETHCQYVQRD